MPLDTERLSERYRNASINLGTGEVLITDYRGTQQETDLTEPANCDGVGRIRHFRRHQKNWNDNPLPIDPACHSLGLANTDELRAQVFQNAACNWRCWYCFVPFDLLSANTNHARWITAADLVACYRALPNRPPMIDLTGGQPDLTPEWIPWMLRSLRDAGLQDTTYVWSDDNLSNDYFWRYLTAAEIATITEYEHYGRVACFKGFDETSFAFNTSAAPTLFNEQFTLFERFLTLKIDLYAYTTFTAPTSDGIAAKMRDFVDRLQRIHHNLPLRTVPLPVAEFTPVTARMNTTKQAALQHQHDALHAWNEEVERRYSGAERSMNIAEVPL